MSQPLTPVPQQQGQQPAQQRNLGQLIANLGPQSSVVSQSAVDPRALAAGIKPSFATLTFKGKVWGIRHRGMTSQLLARDPQSGAIIGAIPTVDIVIVKAATAISKAYYIEKYKEGDFNQPDCWSTNGVAPDAAAPHKQNPTCRGCKWDAFGSRTMDDGRKGKACSDAKRIAVVPAADIKNESYGGPMLLKLPPSSFAGLSELENQLHMQGYAYFAVVMRLSFDHQAAFPKVIFTPIAVLNDQQALDVIEAQKNEVVDRILSEEVVEVTGDPGQPPVSERQAAPAAPVITSVVATPTQSAPAQPAPPVVQAFNPIAPMQAGPPIAQPDPMAIPGFLQRSSNGAANGAAVTQPAPTPQPETAEQKIARLEAELAATKEAKPGRRAGKRSGVVTPAGTQVAVVPPQPEDKGPPLPFTQHAVAGEAAGTAETDDEGDTPPDLDSRIDALLKGSNT